METPHTETRPMQDVRVVDFTHVWQGPIATQMLADFGADVIKVERPGRGDWTREYGPFVGQMSCVFAGLNRNKRSVVIDAKHPRGKQILDRLLESADVVVHNFRPGVDVKLGLDFATLSQRNRRLVHARSSGWGDRGPYVDERRGGHAKMAAAAGGLFSEPRGDHVPQPPTISVDYPAGLLLCIAILMGLRERDRTGQPQQVSTDLLSAAAFAHAWAAGAVLNHDRLTTSDQKLGAIEKSIPNAWKTADGYIEISPVFADDALRDLATALELPELLTDPRFDEPEKRLAHAHELEPILAERFAERPTSHWMKRLTAAGVLCAEINTLNETLEDPQLRANDMIVSAEHPAVGPLRALGVPIRFPDAAARQHRAAPLLGEHTMQVLRDLGYDQATIDKALEERAVVAAQDTTPSGTP